MCKWSTVCIRYVELFYTNIHSYYEIEMGAICTNFLGIFEIGDILYRRKLWVYLFVSKQFGEKRL